ncbi:MAG: cysteine-rich CWC family protein [Chitinophaga sp.]|uniref:cysteine-rich CWC family protein n=1 Tax=Chitinophaga sp. TaxID=1869181 RepID=UPI001B0BA47E|nr:cysteine-rich CWC family protein [Chitinophaga sp.]MBO9727549.1 cysteine-rich CWC family protein [Chitinophaga sp.]
MACHETVTCPRCQRTFECRVGTILRCQCQDISLSEEERHFIQQQYSGCLCIDCLRELKSGFPGPPAPLKKEHK